MGAFHSGEFEGLWSRFPGLKLLYPATAQETFEALVAGFYDPNPCLVFEHKLLYWSKSGEIDFDGNLESIWRPRRYTEGTDLTLVAFGAMVHEALAAAVAQPPFHRGLEPVRAAADGHRPDPGIGVQDGAAAGGAGVRGGARSGRTRDLPGLPRGAGGAEMSAASWSPRPICRCPSPRSWKSYCRPNSHRIEAVVDQMVREG